MSLSVLRRFRATSPEELRERAGQGIARWLERLGAGNTSRAGGDRLEALVTEPDGPVVRGPFFACIDDKGATLGALRAVDPEFETRLCARARRVASGRFDLLAHRDLTFGDPIDWRLEPVSGVRSPDVHWSRVAFMDPAVVGDHKLVWELARHQGLVTLAQAWWCTGDPAYAGALVGLLEGWLAANPPKRGVHWVSSLELSFRSIAWLWMLALAEEVLPPALRRRVLAHLVACGRHIERYLSTWFSPNTHLTGEALGLFALGTVLPQCHDAARWRDRGAGILLEWLPRHVRADGSYVEQSTWYHRYTTDFYLHFLILAGRAGRDVRPVVESPLQNLLEVLAWISRPDGTMPMVGDDDGGRLLFLDERTAHDTQTPLAIGAALFGRPDLKWVAGAPTPELVWLLGPEGLARFERTGTAIPAASARAFVDGGIHVLRSGWDAAASMVVVDAGPHGFLNGGHAHADALSIDLTARGQPVFVDPGTFTYTTSPEWRDRFRLTASHSAVTIDGCGSATPDGAFHWRSRANARQEAWFDSGSVVLFQGSHDGFERLRPTVRYRRSIVLVRPDTWLFRDEMQSEGDHELAVHWQCAPDIVAEVTAGGVVLLRGGAEVLTMRVAEAGGTWSLSREWASGTYGAREPATHVRYVRREAGPQSVTTLLCRGPGSCRTGQAEGHGIPPALARAGSTTGLLLTGWSAQPPWLETDANLSWLQVEDGRAELTVAGATRLAVQGRDFIGGVGQGSGLVVEVPLELAERVVAAIAAGGSLGTA